MAGGHRREPSPRERGLGRPVLVVALLTVAVVGVGLAWSRAATPPARGAGRVPRVGVAATVPPVGGTTVRFSFDGGLAALAHPEPGQPALTLRSAEGGQITGVPHGTGTALEFPAPCAEYGAASCPRAVLVADDEENLVPGTHGLRWGATIRLTPGETTPGSNIVQKGFATGGGQFKLQVDGAEGRPSCVLVDSAENSPINAARADVSVADGNWHVVICDRTGTSLTVTVDGTVAGTTSVPADLSVITDARLSIGGKGTSPNNDQFSGALDDVFVEIGP